MRIIRAAILSLLLSLLFLIVFLTPTMVEAQPSLCFIKAYNASFSDSLLIYPSGSFNPRVSGGSYGFSSNGFKGKCLSFNVSSGGYSYIDNTFSIKGAFKISFILKIVEGSNLNFTRIVIRKQSSLIYDFRLGLDSSLRLVIYRLGGKNEGTQFEAGKWYNLTISLDVSTDTLTILRNGTQAISPISTGVELYSMEHIFVQLGVININSTSDVKTYLDEFSIALSPIIFTDKPIYSSSTSVPVRITGDQFPASILDIAIIRPNGSTLMRYSGITVNSTGGFSYSTSLNNPSPGTYTVRVNGSGCRVEYHFGVWDLSRTWERKSIISVKAGGLMPGGFAILYVRNSTHVVFSQRLDSNSRGEVNQQVNVPVNMQLGTLTAFLNYSSIFDFQNMKGTTSSLQVTVMKAVLNVTVTTDATTYERLKPININVYVKYKDGSSLSREGVVKLNLVYGGVEGRDIFMDYTHDSYWSKSIKLGASDFLGSYLIKVEASDQYGNSGNGNKTITLTSAKLTVSLRNDLDAHYERSTKLNISVSVTYPDETPVGSGRVTLEMLMGSQRKGPFSFTSTGLGQWDISQTISVSEQTGNWTVRIIAVDDSENSGDLSVGISIVPARLNVQILNSMANRFSRTQNIPVSIVVRYPSQEVLSREYGVVNASLIHMDNGLVSNRLLQFSAGSWSGNISAPRDAPLGSYIFKVSARDTYGNYGFYNTTVEVTMATLSVEAEGLKDVYQISFDTVSVKSIVKYPDGSSMDEGNVTAVFSSGSMSATLPLKYENGKWIGQYPLPMTAPAGDYTMRINAEDPYGNTGSNQFIFRVSNLYLILIIISIAITLGVSVSFLIIRRRRARFQPPSEEYDVLG
ncbi:MAG: hypothetical protein QW304_04130 [Thermoproteota archaeon]